VANYGGGDANRGYGYGSYDPRQWNREWEERLRELQDIRAQLGRGNQFADDLARIEGNIRNLMNARNGVDPGQLDKLAQQVIDPFRSVELELSRELQVLLAKENIRSAQEEEIPEGYKKLVEEYYKKLSNQKSN
jgi:hypothetical protein